MMKRIHKLMILGLFMLGMTVSVMPNTVQAQVIDGDYTVEEGATEIDLSEEEIEILQEKERALEAFIESWEGKETRSTATWHYLTTSFPNNVQINGYYCGPATVQNVIKYHTGTTYSQSTLASALGTTTSGTVMANIDDVLRSYTNKNYVYADIESESKWKRRVANNINDSNMAVIIDINSTGCSSWPYSTSGHFIPIYACYDATTTSCTKVMISDSHPNYNKRWSVSASIAYQVNDAHFNNAMIW